MPDTDDFDVRYLANLARLDLTEEEASTFQTQLDSILAHMKRLKAIDVEGIDPTAHANPVYDVIREDEPGDCLPHETALSNAPRKRLDQFSVTKVIE